MCVADFSKFKVKSVLDEAAKRYTLGLQAGLDENELIALELGVPTFSELTDAQRTYSDKLKEKLCKRAEELKREETERKLREARNMELGKRAYEKGEYPASVALFEQAVKDLGDDTLLGGEAQLWLALAYQACGREQDCIELYKFVERNHPNKKIKKQAANLRYIMEAPKLKLSEDERVHIPLLQSDSWRRDERKPTLTPKFMAKAKKPQEARSTYWDRVTWELPLQDIVPDKWYYRVAWAAVIIGATLYANWQYRSI